MEMELGAPSPTRYLMGAAVMMIGVVFPVGYMMFRNNMRVPTATGTVPSSPSPSSSSSSSFAKHT